MNSDKKPQKIITEIKTDKDTNQLKFSDSPTFYYNKCSPSKLRGALNGVF